MLDSPQREHALVRIGPSTIHGYGGFATRDIPRETRILEYLGECITKSESLRRCQTGNQCIFCFNETYDLDGSVEWNPARFLNHSCSPNCDARLIQGRIWIVAGRHIAPGEELTFNYNYDLADYADYPCQCGSPACAGFIVAEEFFDRVRRRVNQT